MHSEKTAAVSSETIDSIFELLKRQGPLCASQISIDLVIPLREVVGGLIALTEEGLVERRVNEPANKADDVTAPYGVTTRVVARRATSI